MEEPPTIREIFAAAIEIESRQERAEYLDEACGGDVVLRAELDGLILAHLDAGSFFNDGNEASLVETDATGQKEGQEGTQIGPYKLRQQIGEGGMGSVWMAEQEKPVRRMVALKIIKAGMDSEQVIARFEAERQALALMSHPNIAKVLDAGTTESGRPYFVMELVKGVPITEFCDKNEYPAQQRLKLFVDVCHAVQHAHQKGVIHRDIKPSNVMVTLYDGVPVAKVIDFGLAKAIAQKLTERSLFTAYGQMVGTPTYMSPEQAEMSGLDVDTRTDVYSLGVLLYELMTGTTPIDAKKLRKAGFAEIQRIIQQEEAPPMSTRLSSLGGSSTMIASQRGSDPWRLSHFFRGDLDVIVAKSLDKDRSRRYATPSEFADDIQRFVNHEAIEARPASTAYRLRKLYQRNRVAVLTVAAVACILVLATLFSSVQAFRAKAAKDVAEEIARSLKIEQDKTRAALRKAEQSEREAKWNTYVARLFPMQQAWRERDFGRLNQLLKRSTPKVDEPDFRGWEWYFFEDEVKSASTTIWPEEKLVAASPKYPEFAVLAGSHIEIFDWYSRNQQRVLQLRNAPRDEDKEDIWKLEWSPKANYLAVACKDVSVQDPVTQLYVLDSKSGNEVLCVAPFDQRRGSAPTALAWHPEEKAVAISNWYGDIVIVDIETARIVTVEKPKSTTYCLSLAWHPSGEKLAAGLRYGNRVLFDLKNEDRMVAERLNLAVGSAVAWNPSGTRLASMEGNDIRVFGEDLKQLQLLSGHNGAITQLRWINDERLISASEDHCVHVWDTEIGTLDLTLNHHTQPIRNLAVNHSGRMLLSSAGDGVKLADLELLEKSRGTLVPTKDLQTAFGITSDDVVWTSTNRFRWDPSGKKVFVNLNTMVQKNSRRDVRFWDAMWNAASLRQLSNLEGRSIRGVEWTASDRILRYGTFSRSFHRFDPFLRELESLGSSPPRAKDADGNNGMGIVDFHPHLPIVAVAAEYGRWWDLIDERSWEKQRHVRLPRTVCDIRWDNKGSFLAVCGLEGSALFDRQGNLRRLSPRQVRGRCLAWHPSSAVLFTGAEDGTIVALSVDDLEELIIMSGHLGNVNDVECSPCGGRLASAGQDGTIRIWDVATGLELIRLAIEGVKEFTSVEWSPDGLQLGATTNDGQILIWGSEAMQRPAPNTSTLETGVVGGEISQRTGGSLLQMSAVVECEWKKYVPRIRRILDRMKQNASVADGDKYWSELESSILQDEPRETASRQFLSAAVHLLEGYPPGPPADWLADHLIKFLRQQVTQSPTGIEHWRAMADVHSILAHGATNKDEAESHWAETTNALRRVVELDRNDKLTRRRLEFICARHLGDPELSNQPDRAANNE